jgi:hypothetical protein
MCVCVCVCNSLALNLIINITDWDVSIKKVSYRFNCSIEIRTLIENKVTHTTWFLILRWKIKFQIYKTQPPK